MKIEKGIPMPRHSGGRPKGCLQTRSGATETLAAMEVGDSVFVPCDGFQWHSVRSSWGALARSKAVKVACRRMEGGVRIWKMG